MVKIVIGIDVGKSGGVAKIYPDNSLEYFRMPMIGSEYDIQGLKEILTPKEGEEIVHVGIEHVHAIQQRAGASSNFSFGMGKGILMGLTEGLGHRYTLVNPRTWQKIAWEGVTRQKDNKHTSLLAAKRLFPGYSFLATPKSRKPHDGIVDAILIAYYCKVKFFNEQ